LNPIRTAACITGKKFLLLAVIFTVTATTLPAPEINHLAAFADPARIWGNGIEKVIEEAYRACFRTRIIGGRVMNIRMPFALNNDRDILVETKLEFVGGGKSGPLELWPVIEAALDTEDFRQYVQTLGSGREQVIVFDMENRSWHSSRDRSDIARIKAGSYQGLPHRPHFFVTGNGITEADIYNYLFCINLAGMDCSGFVWYILSHIARQDGLDLGNALRLVIGAPRGADPATYVGTSFFNSRNRYIDDVNDRIGNLRPADVILFRGINGQIAHAAIIQSVNFEKGIIRYFQSTSVAPLDERGVHESFVHFDPAKPDTSLRDPGINWMQKREASFPGEELSPFSDDGEYYRSGGRVVRFNILTPVIDRMNNRKGSRE